MRITIDDPTPAQQKALDWLSQVEDRLDTFVQAERESAHRNRQPIAAALRARFSAPTKPPRTK